MKNLAIMAAVALAVVAGYDHYKKTRSQ